ncbi:MAG: hypothetical protein O9333_02545 [Beijerinckiaceae bacterium]|jgi:hypothetical protein|nr:hypothetical protein [Beijerinckiaceae bacterium]
MIPILLGRKPSRRDERRAQDLVIEPGSRDEPPIGAEMDNPGIRWDLMYVLFLRLTAAIWLLKGIAFWALILGLGDIPLTDESRARQVIIIGFSLIDCVAAIGLWLVAPWGKSLWVFAVVAEIVLGITGFGNAVGVTSASGAGLALFFFFVLAFAVRRRQLGIF